MNTLYWLTVLGKLNLASSIILFISSVVLAVTIICYFNCDMDDRTNVIKTFKVNTPIFLISLIVTIFVPTTENLYIIYGVGSTIDYLKSNPTAKQLPDKYIKVLDKWSDELLEDKEKE